ncbi:MAG: aldehyde dehydrogenase [Gammaproteobacteria bacterium]|nr:aldehyde dehydrogenase [Gammaproteobacteria bacterium]
MQEADFKSLLVNQQRFFSTGATLSVDFRITQLKKLKTLLQTHEAEIAEALKKDLNKSHMEAVTSEIMLVIEEMNYIIKHLKCWSKPQKVKTPVPFSLLGQSMIYHEPYGSVLIIGPWNYPFLLMMSPLIGAMSAGNCVVIKPSDIASHTEKLLVKLLQTFTTDYIAVVTGGRDVVEKLLQEKFAYIFFTGGTQVGKIIMTQAAQHLTPVTLELGGKSPCIIDETAKLDYAARRIMWAKTLNAGQVCIAPDYVYVHESCKQAFIKACITAIKQFYGEDPSKSASYGRIINKNHFLRLMALLEKNNIIYGGENNLNDLYISPTLIENISWESPIMQEEIFGPLLPVMTFKNSDDILPLIKANAKPLALYLFTHNKQQEEKIVKQLSFGGGCINDCLLHIANYHLPFGGVGLSGMGAYHGKYSFETFSHQKGIYKKTRLLDFNLEYPPYHSNKLRWLRNLLKIGNFFG